MKAKVEIEGLKLEVDFSKVRYFNPLMFNGSQPNTYNVNKATSQAYTDGQFIGDTRKMDHVISKLIA